MLMSIVIPVYNRAEVVKPTLDTVVEQTHRPLQVVLVDNDSSDNTLATLQQFKHEHETADFHVDVVQEMHHSASAARNRGFAEAKADWVMFFDSDDTMAPTLVEEYVKVIERHPHDGLDIVLTHSRVNRHNGVVIDTKLYQNNFMVNQILHSILSTQRYCVRRAFFAQTDGWDVDLLAWDDLELGTRLMAKHPRIDFVKQLLVFQHEQGEDSITGTDYSSKPGRWEKVFPKMEKAIIEAHLPDETRLLRLIDYRRVQLAALYAHEGHPELGEELYSTGYARLKKHCLILRWAIPMLYRFIKSGHRGASRIAKILIR